MRRAAFARCACACVFALLAGCRPETPEAGPIARSEPRVRLTPYVETLGEGRIDWGSLRVLTDAPDPARALAFVLSEAVMDARDSAGGVIGPGGALGRIARTMLVRSTVGAAAELSLTGEGGPLDLLYDKAVRRAPSVGAAGPPELRARREAEQTGHAPGDIEDEADALARWAFGTGPEPLVLIDARGLGARPALFPTVRDAWGEAVYNVRNTPRETALDRGLARYARLAGGLDPRELRLRDVDGRPIEIVHVRAAAADGPRRAELVLAGDEARRMAAMATSLAAARVMVILDAPTPVSAASR